MSGEPTLDGGVEQSAGVNQFVGIKKQPLMAAVCR
jgi:hypothetical protein